MTWRMTLGDVLKIMAMVWAAAMFDARLSTVEKRQVQTPTWTELEATTGLSKDEWRTVWRARATERQRWNRQRGVE